jgi:hypothetical protein
MTSGVPEVIAIIAKTIDLLKSAVAKRPVKKRRQEQHPYYYKKRLAIYLAARNVALQIQNQYSITEESMATLEALIVESSFLYDSTIAKGLRTLVETSHQLNLQYKIHGSPRTCFLKEQNIPEGVIKYQSSLLEWGQEGWTLLEVLITRYLRVEEIDL